MKTFKKILMIILTVLPALYTAAAVFFFLPDTIAAHFGTNGTPDRYGSKYEAFIFPAVILVSSLIYFLFRKIMLKTSTDEDSRTAKNVDIIDTVITVVLILFNVMNVFFLIIMAEPKTMKNSENLIYVIISTVIGLLFIIIGNIMPKTRRNSIVGIRMSFCMDSDEHWYIANRAGGIALVLSGIATIIGGLIIRGFSYIFVMIISLIVFLTVATVCSYVIIKGKKK